MILRSGTIINDPLQKALVKVEKMLPDIELKIREYRRAIQLSKRDGRFQFVNLMDRKENIAVLSLHEIYSQQPKHSIKKAIRVRLKKALETGVKLLKAEKELLAAKAAAINPLNIFRLFQASQRPSAPASRSDVPMHLPPQIRQ